MSLKAPSSYPFRGIVYLITHPRLWPHVLCSVVVTLIFALIATILLFVYAFPAQAAGLCQHFPVWLAWLCSFFLTLFEIGVAVLVFSSLYLAYYMDVIFDAVWRQETTEVNAVSTTQSVIQSPSCIKSFLILIFVRVILVVITAPLNLVPCLGTILFLYINGFYYGWSLHCRYFDLIDLSFSQGKHFVEQRRSDYIQFGMIGVLLEMIPVVNLITPITNVIGSALWACDIEQLEEPLRHPRNYLLAPSPQMLEQGDMSYGATKSEKEKQAPPPPYQEPTQQTGYNIYPSAPVAEKE